MIRLNITDETSDLESVILGIGHSMGKQPTISEAYDPQSKYQIKNGSYPIESDIVNELELFQDILKGYGVKVYRPDSVEALNQVFARDIGFIIEDKFVVPEILIDRQREIEGVKYIVDQVDSKKIIHTPKGARIEGGDVIPYQGKLFVGYSKQKDFDQYTVARTNEAGVEFLIESFPEWNIIAMELHKSDHSPQNNVLHLDCCFQPVGKEMAIICKEGFKHAKDCSELIGYFGQDNIIEVSKENLSQLQTNVFSISPEVVVSDKRFTEVNSRLIEKGLKVEELNYHEVSKMGGLFRCSTFPLSRK